MWTQWQVDFYQILYRLVAWFYRAPIFKSWLQVIASGINYVNAEFFTFRGDIIYLLTWNTQVIVLEKFLNGKFNIPYDVGTRDADIASHTIIWVESSNTIPHYIYNRAEARPKTIIYNRAEHGPVFILKNTAEYFASNSFIVHVPATLTFDMLIMANWINTYRLASKSFTIVTY